MDERLVIIIGPGGSGRIVVNYLLNKFPIACVIREKKESRKKFLLRRAKHYGWWKVIGQLLFLSLVVPFLKSKSKKRVQRIMQTYQLSDQKIDSSLQCHDVVSVNDDNTIQLLQENTPSLVLVVGTRIIGKKTLKCVDARFINIHAGITPLYRGVHGGYWSLVNDDGNFGATIHYLDEGIDTGGVIKQVFTGIDKKDNFVTYPYLQLAVALEALVKLLPSLIKENKALVEKASGSSQLWTHPTIFEYFFYLIRKHIK